MYTPLQYLIALLIFCEIFPLWCGLCTYFIGYFCDENFYGFAKANETKREVNLYDDNSNETKHLTQYKNYIQHIEMINNFYRGGEIKYKLNWFNIHIEWREDLKYF